ncbi:tetratricopeptide repeat protein [Oceanospirillaceae bacterium]|jgi:tetratricopeptide (TPR) repeat protein|nr:tetratricopeptide repeat protein [Oceanospirillaceae bacterium]MDB4536547.1 tetratricopeptide repeat protein [Oceanospirillaceae bacterium]
MELTIQQALQQGVAAHKKGQVEEAERLYKAILNSQPAQPDANHNLGVLLVSINKTDAALPLFKVAVETNSKVDQFWLSYIDALIKAKQGENAKQVLEQAKNQGVAEYKLDILKTQLNSLNTTGNVYSANPPQKLLSRLLEHYQSGRLGDAEILALSITRDFPNDNFSWMILAAVFKAIGRNTEALNANQTAVELSPQDAEAHSNLGVTLQELGRLNEAEVSLRQAIVLRPNYPEAHNNLGNALKEQGRLDEAEASYRQAIVLNPGYANAHSNLGATLQELSRLDEAEASYIQAIALRPNYAEAYSNLGVTLQELGRLEEAEESLKHAITLKPDFALAHYGLTKVLYNMSYKDSALESIKKANVIDPKSKDFSLLLSVLQARKARENTAEGVKNTITSDSLIIPASKILELNRSVEQELITYLYSRKLLDLDKEKDPSFGDTRGSKYDLFEDNHPRIQKLEIDLHSILSKAFNSDIFIKDSFFSIFGAGGGTTRHQHVDKNDKDSTFSLAKQKYALVYYLSVGDQDCTEPGFLKFYEPSEEILPKKGLITIFPAQRYHSSFYNGKKDRVIVGVNFYTL